MDIQSFLSQEMASRIKETKKHLAVLRKGQRVLDNKLSTDAPLMYEVTLISSWANEGEKSVTVQGQGNLKEIFARAIREFLKVNHRSDVQTRYRVMAYVTDQVALLVPDAYWAEYKFSRSPLPR